jgi:LytS/YehU family sensor histidine kinase
MQIRPHFLFNTLNSVSGLVRIGDSATAVAMLSALGDLLRLLLHGGDDQLVPLRRELDLVEHYLRIEQIRFGDQLHVEVAIEPGVENALIPNLILQPLVENAIRHGIRSSGRVVIGVRRHGPVLRMSVSDSGDVEPGESDAGGDGIGLSNTRARLARHYGGAHRFDLSYRDTGATAVIEIPLEVAS